MPTLLSFCVSIMQMEFYDSLRKELKRYRDQAAKEVVSVITVMLTFL